jgi:hypothetical protein
MVFIANGMYLTVTCVTSDTFNIQMIVSSYIFCIFPVICGTDTSGFYSNFQMVDSHKENNFIILQYNCFGQTMLVGRGDKNSILFCL